MATAAELCASKNADCRANARTHLFDFLRFHPSFLVALRGEMDVHPRSSLGAAAAEAADTRTGKRKNAAEEEKKQRQETQTQLQNDKKCADFLMNFN